jgi:hypothetical protein
VQILLFLLARGDVEQYAHRMCRPALRVAFGASAQFDPARGSVEPANAAFENEVALRGRRQIQRDLDPLPVVSHDMFEKIGAGPIGR